MLLLFRLQGLGFQVLLAIRGGFYGSSTQARQKMDKRSIRVLLGLRVWGFMGFKVEPWDLIRVSAGAL